MAVRGDSGVSQLASPLKFLMARTIAVLPDRRPFSFKRVYLGCIGVTCLAVL